METNCPGTPHRGHVSDSDPCPRDGNPPPITIAGQTYAQWKYVRANPTNPTMELVVDSDGATMFMCWLSRTLPGTLPDGTSVQYFVYSVQRVAADEAIVQVSPEFVPEGRYL